MRLNQPQDRVPPLQAPILTNMRARVGVGGRCGWHTSRAAARLKARLMQGCCGPHRGTSGLLLCAICMHCVHHVQEGADDVTALLVARLLYVPAIARVDLRCG